MQKKTLP